MVDGASRHLFSKGEKNAASLFSFNFRTLLASLHAASRAHRSCHSGCAFCGIQVFFGDTKTPQGFFGDTKVFFWDTKGFLEDTKKCSWLFRKSHEVSSIVKLLMTFSKVKSGKGGGSTVGGPKAAAKRPEGGGPEPRKSEGPEWWGSGGWLWASSREISVVFSRLLWIPVNLITIGYSLFSEVKGGLINCEIVLEILEGQKRQGWVLQQSVAQKQPQKQQQEHKQWHKQQEKHTKKKTQHTKQRKQSSRNNNTSSRNKKCSKNKRKNSTHNKSRTSSSKLFKQQHK